MQPLFSTTGNDSEAESVRYRGPAPAPADPAGGVLCEGVLVGRLEGAFLGFARGLLADTCLHQRARV